MTSKIKVDNIADQDDNNIINESGDVITVGAAGDTVAVAGNIVKSNNYWCKWRYRYSCIRCISNRFW
jgi:hypothetical protein